MDANWGVAALGALAQEKRLDVFMMLARTGPAGLPAGKIAIAVGMLPSSLTFHIQQLFHAGLVTQRRVSRQLFYAMVPDAMNALVGYLTANCYGQADTAPVCAPVRKPAVSKGAKRASTA